MGADASISLLVASLDLQLVRLLRDAMAPANGGGSDIGGTLAGSGRGEPASGLGPAPTFIERRFHIHPEPKIEPRRHIHPEPRVEPREVIRPPDRFEPSNAACVPVPCECYKPPKPYVVEPPWKVLPWEQELPCERVERPIKVVVKPPDIAHKGSLIDFFI